VITYTVFDPDDGSGRTYWWYREAMVYVHQDGREVDAFEVDTGESGVPSFDEISAAVEARHRAG
jgi:hypothetical protein